MTAPGDPCIAVCATATAALDALVGLVRAGGARDVLAICGRDPAALDAARAGARLYVLDSAGGAAGERLALALAARPSHAPLIAIGRDPAVSAAPTLWLGAAPPAARLARLIAALLDEPAAGAPATAWRRKSDVIVGDSPGIRQVREAIDRLTPVATPVLITGESGVGKELVARALHHGGPRAPARFVAINCAAIPDALIEAELFGYQRGAFTGADHAHPGAVEAAHHGTLFLDEIGDLPLAMQPKLLRVLETGEVQRLGSSAARQVDFRLVTATHRDLDDAVQRGRFRADLYYRLRVVPVHVPALRERAEDIPRLVHHHLAMIAARERRAVPRISPEALAKLTGHAWPGNVRELVNLLERAVLLAGGEDLAESHVVLPGAPGPAPPCASLPVVPYREAKARFELEYYAQLMRAAGGNVSLAAKLGDKTRKEIYAALRRCGLTPRPADPAALRARPERPARSGRRA